MLRSKRARPKRAFLYAPLGRFGWRNYDFVTDHKKYLTGQKLAHKVGLSKLLTEHYDMANQTPTTNSITCAAELQNVGTERQNQILNVILATTAPEPTSWRVISDAVGEKVKIRKNGWMSVRGLLQWLIDERFVARVPFDAENPYADECYVRLTR